MLFEEKYTLYSKLTYKEEITIDYVLLLIQPFNRRDNKFGRAGGFIFLEFVDFLPHYGFFVPEISPKLS